jgi:hypothetical protein
MMHFADDCVFESARGPDRWGRRLAGKDVVRRGAGGTLSRAFRTFTMGTTITSPAGPGGCRNGQSAAPPSKGSASMCEAATCRPSGSTARSSARTASGSSATRDIRQQGSTAGDALAGGFTTAAAASWLPGSACSMLDLCRFVNGGNLPHGHSRPGWGGATAILEAVEGKHAVATSHRARAAVDHSVQRGKVGAGGQGTRRFGAEDPLLGG